MVSQRTALIARLADDVSYGWAIGKYDHAYFYDGLIDKRRVTTAELSIMATLGEGSDAYIDVRERVRKLIEAEAIKFFTDEGKEYVDGLLAEIERDRETERRAA